VYRYGRFNDSCIYVTYSGYVAARTQLSGKNIILNDRPSPRPNIMQVVNEPVYLKQIFQAVWPRPRPWRRSTRGRGHIHEAEAICSRPRPLKIGLEAETRPRRLTSLPISRYIWQTIQDSAIVTIIGE